MANSTPFDGTNFLPDAPDQAQPHGNDFREHQSTRKSMQLINNKEHDAIATDPSAADAGGEHVIGSAKIYYGDYSTASAGDNLPTLRPDATTSLDTSDVGRLAYDSNATYGPGSYRWNGSAWEVAMLDEDDMVSDSDTLSATQQSIKAYISNIILVDTVAGGTFGAVSESIEYPNGLIQKFGQVNIAGLDTDVTFAIAFPGGVRNVQISPVDSSGVGSIQSNGSLENVLVTGFRINSNSSAIDSWYWTAWGY